ncbi:MAG: restriction endonuclease subunit S [Epsilonproteobacteria bacterium]|nr:MAG: restriction endonuclease subunit S [Campylobacterota bacterium]
MNFKELGYFAKVQGGYAYKSKDFIGTGIPIIKIKNVGKGNLLFNETSYVDKSFLDETKNYTINVGDVLISMTGSNINQPASMVGRVARVSKDDPIALINQRVGRLILKNENIIDLRFLYYYLSQYEVQYYLVLNATGSANQVNINGKLIESIKIPDFTFEKTVKIVNILSTLDDKIELNRKMNQTLEDMAQALFKSWFVDFDFPNNNGEMEDSELGMIPKGWRVERFGNTIEKYIDNRGKTPPTVEDGIPLLEVRNMPDDMLTANPNVVKFVTEDTYKSWFRSYLKENDILISTVGTIGKTCIIPKDSKIAIAQNVLGLRFKNDMLKSQFMFYQMKYKRFLHAIDARLVITVQASIKRKDLDTIDVIIPPIKIQEFFVKQIQPIIEKQQSSENTSLEKTRDTLLPKLLSGEIEV